jgi:hypothetical protein
VRYGRFTLPRSSLRSPFSAKRPTTFKFPAKISTESDYSQKNKVRALNELSNEFRINKIGRLVNELIPFVLAASADGRCVRE